MKRWTSRYGRLRNIELWSSLHEEVSTHDGYTRVYIVYINFVRLCSIYWNDCSLQQKIITLCLTDSQVRIYVKQHQTPLVFKVNRSSKKNHPIPANPTQPFPSVLVPPTALSKQNTSTRGLRLPRLFSDTWSPTSGLTSRFLGDRCWMERRQKNRGQGVSCRAKRKDMGDHPS